MSVCSSDDSVSLDALPTLVPYFKVAQNTRIVHYFANDMVTHGSVASNCCLRECAHYLYYSKMSWTAAVIFAALYSVHLYISVGGLPSVSASIVPLSSKEINGMLLEVVEQPRVQRSAEEGSASEVLGSGVPGFYSTLQEPYCRSCENDFRTCSADVHFSNGTFSCYCDRLCESYGDCCMDKPACDGSSLPAIEQLSLECKSSHLDDSIKPVLRQGFWVISSCPFRQTSTDVAAIEEEWIDTNCTDGPGSLPFASDYLTGRTYRNVYCALCNNVSTIVPWGYRIVCNSTLWDTINSSSVVTLNQIQEDCQTCSFSLPEDVAFSPEAEETFRPCTPHVSTCLSFSAFVNFTGIANLTEDEYEKLEQNCTNGSYNLVRGLPPDSSAPLIFRNAHCAACNGLDVDRCDCYSSNSSQDPCVSGSDDRLVLLLDPVTGAIEPEQTDSVNSLQNLTLATNCSDEEFFDFASKECVQLSCDGCILSFTDAVALFDSGNTDGPAPSANVTCIPMVLTNPSEYTVVEFQNQVFVLYEGLVYFVVNPGGDLPLICVGTGVDPSVVFDFSLYLIQSVIKIIAALTYPLVIISVVANTLIIFTYVSLKKLRTVFGLVAVNLSVTFLFSDFFLLLGGPAVLSSGSRNLCVAVAIFEHLFTLAQFIWLCIMALDISLRYYRMANSLPSRRSLYVIGIYLGFGWGIPAIMLLLGISGNFSKAMFISYGTEKCHINRRWSAVVFFLLPNLIAQIVSWISVVFVLVALCKIPFSFDRKDKCRFGTFITLLVLMGLLWLLLVLFLLSNSPFVALLSNFLTLFVNCIRSVFLCIALVFTSRVLNLYLAICRPKSGNRITRIHPGPSERPELPAFARVRSGNWKQVTTDVTGREVARESLNEFAMQLEDPSKPQEAWQ